MSNASISVAYMYPRDEGCPEETTPSRRLRKVGATNWDASLHSLKGRAVRMR